MASPIPNTMRALALSEFSEPKMYNTAEIPTPEITQVDELLIKVAAASINPIDVKLASGLAKLLGLGQFPYKIGYDLAGTVVAVGSGVTRFKAGDAIYSRAPEKCRGSVAEYALTTEGTTALKPSTSSFTEAASIPLAAQTALQSLDRADAQLPGGLKGKTVYVPAGLSGTGSFAVQLAKSVFGASKVITTLSSGKMATIQDLMGVNAPDQLIDYTKEDITAAIGAGTVDFMFDTVKQTLSAVPLMKKGGLIVSISTIPSGSAMKAGMPGMPFYVQYLMDLGDWFFRTWTSWKGVHYSYLALFGNSEDLERLKTWVEEGKVKPIVGNTTKFADLEGVRRGCQQVFEGKGGVGKFVIEMA